VGKNPILLKAAELTASSRQEGDEQAADARDAKRWRKIRLLPVTLDHERITPIRPDKIDAFVDALPEPPHED
jgi:hypothetical protein